MDYPICSNLKTKLLTIVVIFICFTAIYGQNQNSDSIIFSIGDDVVFKTEFLNQYHKNNHSNFQGDSLSLKQYSDLYLNFKLKVKAAKDSGYDTLPEFLNEFQSYRKQLADKYISNGRVTDEMVNEIYYRMTNEVNASHILLSLKADASPADTLETYNTAINLLKKIDAGESFQELAIQYSKDPSVRTNKGNLGWFKAYKMVYPFEDAAYQLNIGEVSQPIRTQFGYHLIKKNDERPSKGKLVVQHIMKNLKSQDSTYNAEYEITQIYQKVLEGEDFDDLAKQFSDHKPTASNGGKLTPFGIGDLNSQKFSDIAFGLGEDTPISKPFKTQFGWHIIKYVDNIPVEPLDKIKPDIIKRIKTSDRSKRLIENIKKDLMGKYEVSINYEILSLLEERIDNSLLTYKWSYDNKKEDDTLWVLMVDDSNFYLSEFLHYIEKQQRSLDGKTIGEKINMAIDKFSYAKLIQVHNKKLENKSPEFAAEIKTYFEGLLLFEIMENYIWQPLQNDSIAIQNYYDNNHKKFMSTTRINGILASTNSRNVAKDIKKDLNKKSLEVLKKRYPDVIFKSLDETSVDNSSIPKNVVIKNNFTKVYSHNNQFVCLYISEVFPSQALSIDDVRSKIITTLQQRKEEQWIKELKEKYEIFVNSRLIDKLQTDLEN